MSYEIKDSGLRATFESGAQTALWDVHPLEVKP